MKKIKIILLILLLFQTFFLSAQRSTINGFMFGYIFDITHNNFNDFEDIMGDSYDSGYNQFRFNQGIQIAGLYRNVFGSFSIAGINEVGAKKGDYLGKINSTLYDITFSYNIFNSSKFFILPTAGFSFYRYRFLIHHSKETITPEEYISSPRIDIRGLQECFSPGLSYYQIVDIGERSESFWGFSIKYLMELNDIPKYSVKGSKLNMNKAIDLSNLSISFTACIGYTIVRKKSEP